MKHIAILGSTGSIGTSTLSIVASYPERFRVASLAAGSNVDLAFQQCARWRPLVASMATPELAAQLGARLRSSGITGTEVVYGSEGSVRAATLKEVDFVVSAIVGVAGLEATYAAVMAGKPVGLANKECMVAAGEILTRAAREKSVPLLPIDSEHNAIHQCMRAGTRQEVKQIWLTASGGPFRQLPLHEFEHITRGAGAEASDLGDGAAHHHRLGDLAEQGSGDHRGVPPVRSAPGAGEGDGASAVDGALAGGVHRWLDSGADFRHRYAAADPVCAELSGAGGERA